MPRAAREKSNTGIYHVMLRGINRQVIFQDDEDCEKYLQCLGICKEISGFTLHAYCLMSNHLHLLVEVGKETLEQIFKRVGVRYVYWYNWKYERCGHLFQDRFKSEPVNDDAYFLAVLRYIYQNPVKAEICWKPEEYIWSSYSAQNSDSKLIDRSKMLSMTSQKEFRDFVMQHDQGKFIDIDETARLNDREATALIKSLCGIHILSNFKHLEKDKQEFFIRELQKKHCSIRQLARLVEVSKSQIEKMTND